MKGYRFLYYLISTAFVFACILHLPTPAYAQAPAAEWTLMFYMDADNDLEGNQMKDLEEMMAVGSTAKVNVIVLADRNIKGENDDEDDQKYTNRAVGGLKNWTAAKLLVVEKGKLRQLADWGEVNMGDPATLKRFAKTVSSQFPAKRFGLIFGDHGEGWAGIVGDESAADENGVPDTLNMIEIQSALKDVAAATGKLELIGFDACLMANFEAAKAIAPYGKVMVASEELEPGTGWDYTPLLRNFNQNPAIDGLALGRIIVDTYHAFYLGAGQGERDQTVTLGVIDLSKIPPLEVAINDLGSRGRVFMKSGGRATWNKTADARSKTETYGGSDGGEEGDGDFFDIVDYAQKIKFQTPDADTIRAANNVIAATKAAVTYKINGTARPRSSGLSIYFPREKKTLVERAYGLTPFSVSGKWFPFVGDFAGLTTADKRAPEIQNVRTTDAEIERSDVVTVSAQIIDDDDIEETTFILAESDGDRQIIIGAVPTEPDENGILTEEWDGTWFTIGNEDKELICPITNFEEIDGRPDVFLAEVPAQVRFRGGRQWRNITIYFVLDFNQDEVIGEFVYAFEFKGNRAREVRLDPGDVVRPVYLAVDENGDTEELAATDPADMIQIKSPDGLAVGAADVAAGKYLIGFLVTDYSGNTDAALVDVTIE